MTAGGAMRDPTTDQGVPPPADDPLAARTLLQGLSDAQRDRLIATGQAQALKGRGILFRQGEPAEKCFLVQRGRLKLFKSSEAGKESIIRYIGAGEVVAAVAVLKHVDYPVTAEAVEDTLVTGWNKAALLRLLHDQPSIAVRLLEVVLQRLDEVQQRYLELSSEAVERRIAHTLLRLMRHAGKRTPDGIRIAIPLSRQDVADYAGTTLYTASRTLAAWEKKGWILSGRERIVIADPHALVVFAEGG
jgi:CRP-like cAMP-binding protein